MKKQFLMTAVVLITSLSGYAESLVCTKSMRVEVAELRVNNIENTQVQVQLKSPYNGPYDNIEFTGHLVAEMSTSSSSIYELTTSDGLKGKLEVKKFVTDFPDDGPKCPRCLVSPIFKYVAVLTFGERVYDFSDNFYSLCKKITD